MKEDGSRRACFEREFQIREFVPGVEKWSPFMFLSASRDIIFWKALLLDSRTDGLV